MAKAVDILEYLIPAGGWTIVGDDFDSITYDEGVTPVTKKQFDDAAKVVTERKASDAAERAAAKAALLERLGITADEAALLLG